MSASSSEKQRPGRRRAAADRRPRRLRARADRAGGRALALSQQARVLVRRGRRAASRSAFTAAAAGRRSSTSTTACSPRRPTTRPATRSATGPAAEGIEPYDRRAQEGGAAQSRRPRGAPHRRAADPPRHFGDGDSAAARRPAHRDRGAERRHRRARPACSASEYLHEELCGLRFRVSHNAFLQTNTEMAERLYAIAADFAGLSGQGARLRPVLRDRHDRAGAGAPRRRGLGPGERPGCDRRRRAQRARERRSRTPSFVAADARLGIRPLIERAGPARRRDRRPAPRRASRRRSSAGVLECQAPADRLRLLQPDDARSERGPDGRGRIYAAAREAGRHVPADPARRDRGDLREVSRGFGVGGRASTRRSPRRWLRAARSSATRSTWSNDHPGALGLETLAVFAEAAPGSSSASR